jgi:hypothetical protein
LSVGFLIDDDQQFSLQRSVRRVVAFKLFRPFLECANAGLTLVLKHVFFFDFGSAAAVIGRLEDASEEIVGAHQEETAGEGEG